MSRRHEGYLYLLENNLQRPCVRCVTVPVDHKHVRCMGFSNVGQHTKGNSNTVSSIFAKASTTLFLLLKKISFLFLAFVPFIVGEVERGHKIIRRKKEEVWAMLQSVRFSIHKDSFVLQVIWNSLNPNNKMKLWSIFISWFTACWFCSICLC